MSILAILHRALFNILENSAKKSRSGFVCSWWDLRFWGFGGRDEEEDEWWWRWGKMVDIYILYVYACVLCGETAKKDERND